MLSQFQCIWDGHLGHLHVGRQFMELFHPDIAPVQSAPYRTGPRNREFEKVKLDKLLV